MSLVQCPDCGNKISTKANNCPNCGYPISSYKRSYSAKKKKYVIIFVIAVLAIGIIGTVCFFKQKNAAINNLLDYSDSFEINTTFPWVSDETYNMFIEDNEVRLLTYQEKTMFLDYNGTLEYRCMEEDDDDLSAYEIFYIGWSPDITSDAEKFITQEEFDKIITKYDKKYGKHSTEECSFADGYVYTWILPDSKLFDITFFSDSNKFNLRWVLENHK